MRLCKSLLKRNQVNGFVFSTNQGKQMKASTLEPVFYDQLHWVKIRYSDLCLPTVMIEDDHGIES
jgi:hypothetical protein